MPSASLSAFTRPRYAHGVRRPAGRQAGRHKDAAGPLWAGVSGPSPPALLRVSAGQYGKLRREEGLVPAPAAGAVTSSQARHRLRPQPGQETCLAVPVKSRSH